MPTTVYQVADFDLGNSWVVKPDGTQKTSPAMASTTRSVEVALPYGSIVTDATFRVTTSTTRGGAKVLAVNGRTLKYNTANVVDLTNDVANREYDTVRLTFQYQDYGGSASNTTGADKTTYWTMRFRQMELEVKYTTQGGDEPDEQEYTDRPLRTEAPQNAIALCDGYTRGVIALLHPSTCTITEEAGGEYELTMQCPMDDVWQEITPERIIRAPVPHLHLEGIEVVNPSFWQTTKATTLWRKLPSSYWKKSKTTVAPYSALKAYTYGDLVSYGGKVYRYAGPSYVTYPGAPPSSLWVLVDVPVEQETTETVQVPGVKEADLPANTRLVKLADHNSTYMRVQSATGHIGYVKIADCTEIERFSEDTYYSIQPRTITRQYFRIYRTEVSSYDHEVKVSARHISYDLDAMLLGQCAVVEASPQTALAFLQSCYIEDTLTGNYTQDERTIATDITEGEITQDWSYSSPVSALLDPETGIVDILKARLYRDDDDFLLLSNGGTDPRYTIRYATNLIGVTVSTDTSELVTRIIPVAKNQSKAPYYLPEHYIDSDLISRYPVIRYEILEVDAQIGESKQKTGEAEPTTVTEAMVKTQMRDEAAKRFVKDWCDQPRVDIQVEFAMLGDTEEYKQYRGLQTLSLYDMVRVVHPDIVVDINVQVRGYEWDAINLRYISIALGNPFDYGRGTVPGYQIGTRAITERALSPGLKDMIRGGKI